LKSIKCGSKWRKASGNPAYKCRHSLLKTAVADSADAAAVVGVHN